ncbi:ABC transporter permease [bacterium]|nr:ABC transporter permease [bacterium]
MMRFLKNIIAISKSTSFEVIYDTIFAVIITFAIVLILSSRILGLLTPGQELKLVVDIGLSCIYFFSLLIAIFSGSQLIHREIEKGTILLILSKPVQRHEIVIGKYLGLIFTIMLMILLMLFFYLPILWGFEKINYRFIFTTILNKYIEVSLVAAFAIFFSSFCKPVMGIIFTFFVHIAGILVSDLDFIAAQSNNVFFRSILRVIHNIFPNFNNFNIIGVDMNQRMSGLFSFFFPIFYGVLYIILVLTLTITIFRKRII